MHIGNHIRVILDQKRTNITQFASEICCTRTHVYKILNSASINTALLEKISRALDHDFFADLSKSLSEDDLQNDCIQN